MRGLIKLMLVELKLFLREPEAFFFTLIFPMFMLFVFGSIYGNDPVDSFGGRGFVDLSVPSYMGIVIAMTGLVSMPISVATDREKGVLRRLRATPLRPQNILISWVTVYLSLTLAGALMLVLTGKIFYGLRFSGNMFYVFLAFVLSTFSFFALGFLIASLSPTGRSANVIGMVLFFPMMFFSGAAIPWHVLPEGVRMVARFLPLTYVVQLLQGMWVAEPWSQHIFRLAALAGMMIAGMAISAKVFKWE